MPLTISDPIQSSIMCVRANNTGGKTVDLNKKSLNYRVAMGMDRKKGLLMAPGTMGRGTK